MRSELSSLKARSLSAAAPLNSRAGGGEGGLDSRRSSGKLHLTRPGLATLGEDTSVAPGCWVSSAGSAALLDTAAVDTIAGPPSWAGPGGAAAWPAAEEVSAAFISAVFYEWGLDYRL